MTSLASLWIPILVAAVVAFIASSVTHMLIPWHRNDYPKLPNEDQFRAAVKPLAIPPGDYMVPRSHQAADLKSEAFRAKWSEGPNMILTVLPNQWLGMGRSLGLWFVYLLLVSFFIAYIAGAALAPGTDYLAVFRITGATAFLGLAAALWQVNIWYRRSTAVTFKDTIDALIYALLMAGVFGWLWPSA